MMNEIPDDDLLLARFRDWLQAARSEADALADAGPVPVPEPEPEPRRFGLDRLVEEFTALRHEVKLQTKSTRGLQEQAETLLPALEKAIEQFRSVEPREKQAAFEAARSLVETLADLDEALDRGRSEVEKALRRSSDDPSGAVLAELDALYEEQSWFHRSWLRGYHERARAIVHQRCQPGQQELFDALIEGYDLIQARLFRALQSEQILRIETRGQPVDPQLMTVVEVVDAPGHAPGTVLDEIRRGYTWKGRVIQFAEVRAARSSRPDPDADDDDEDHEEEYSEETDDGNDYWN